MQNFVKRYSKDSNIQLIEEDLEFAKKIFNRYATKEGCAHIASEVALSYLSACLRVYRPHMVLECGAGIGTITDTLLSHACDIERVISLENNDFCLDALDKNLSHHSKSRLSIVTNLQELSSLQLQVDMIVADGGWESNAEFSTAKVGTIIFVEGSRCSFRDRLKSFLNRQDPQLLIDFKEYGAVYSSYRLRFSRRFRVPKIYRALMKKGCWIGEVRTTV